MPWHALAFNVSLILCVVYAWMRGGAPERMAATICVLAAAATVMVYTHWIGRFRQVETGVVVVDLATLVAFLALAARSDRYWPLCVAGFQAASIVVHFLKALVDEVSPFAYAIGIGFSGWAIVATIMIGTWRHWRRTRSRRSPT